MHDSSIDGRQPNTLSNVTVSAPPCPTVPAARGTDAALTSSFPPPSPVPAAAAGRGSMCAGRSARSAVMALHWQPQTTTKHTTARHNPHLVAAHSASARKRQALLLTNSSMDVIAPAPLSNLANVTRCSAS
jgi:hypothetical protein